MTDAANLVIGIDSRQVKTGVADLDGLTAAGARAEAATVGLRSGIKGAGVEASAMAASAQLAARAAMDQASSFTASAKAASMNTMAMRETLVVARELARGNFTRIPGSLTLLAQGIGSQGGLSSFASALTQQLGLIKTVQNAELAEQATAAASAAAGVEAAARRAAANVAAADTEIALAEAQLRVTAGTSAEAAAQVRLAEAHASVAAAAAEAAVAEDALGVALGRSMEAGAASAAEAYTTVSALGATLGLTAIAAGLLGAAFADAKDSAEAMDPSAQQFISTLGLTQREIAKLKDVGVTWGDTMRGVFDALAQASGVSASQFDSFWREAFQEVAQVGVSAAQVIAGAFASVAKIASDLKGAAVATITGNWALAAGTPSAAQVGQDALNAFKKGFSATGNFFHVQVPEAANQERDMRLQEQADKMIADRGDGRQRRPRQTRPKQNPGDQELDKLDTQIASENALTQAYLTSDAAVIKAQADQKALTLAVEKHATAAQTAALKTKELALAIATTSANGAKEISNLTFEAGTRKQVNDMVAAGLIPASQANAYMQLEAQLRPLIAAQSLAEGAAKATLTDEIKRLTAAYADNQAQISQGQALSQLASNDNEIEQLQLKNTLLGKSNEEMATALAQLQAMQYLRDHPGIDASTAAGLTASYVQKAQLSVQSPFQQWAKDIPQSAQAINDALENITFKGFDSLGSAIADVVTGTKSLKSAFHDVAASIISDIVQMTVKMLIFKAISSAFGGGGGLGIGSQSDFLSGGSNLFGLSGALAGGGPVDSGKTYLVGEKGPELFRPSSPGTIIPNGQAPANNNQSGPIEVIIGFGDAPEFAPYVQAVAAAAGQQAVNVSVKHTNQTLRQLARPKLSGGR